MMHSLQSISTAKTSNTSSSQQEIRQNKSIQFTPNISKTTQAFLEQSSGLIDAINTMIKQGLTHCKAQGVTIYYPEQQLGNYSDIISITPTSQTIEFIKNNIKR